VIPALTLVLFLGAIDGAPDLAPPTDAGVSPAPRSLFEREMDRSADPTTEIRRHLRAVRAELAARPTDALSPELAAARARNLEILGEYAEAGIFPRNRAFPGLRPVFIDDDGRACAVGYLMLENGGETAARRIAARENFDYLGDIEEPLAAEWIARSGLTAAECAMIQPSYPCFMLADIACASDGEDVLLTWNTAPFIPWITIYRDGELLAQLTQGETSYVDVGAPAGSHQYDISAFDMMCIDFQSCTVDHDPAPAAPRFRRGDVNGDGQFDAIGDAVALLLYGFAGGPAPACLEAADADDDGAVVAIVDAIRILDYGFNGGSQFAAPFPDCGADPSPATNLGCAGPMPTCP